MSNKAIVFSAEHRAKLSKAGTGRPCSPETRAKISAANKGHGHKHTPESKAKIAAANRRRIYTPEMRARLSAINSGRKHSLEARAKMSAARKGEKRSPEHQAALDNVHKGNKYTLGRKLKLSPEARANRSSVRRGPLNPNWRGGISMLEYSWDFTNELKEEVRRRDGYRCQLCGAPQDENIRALDVHHIDYDKKNSDPVNLVTLCTGCHSRTNANREHWMAVFQERAIRQGVR